MAAGCPALGLVGQRLGLSLQGADDGVHFGARFAKLLVKSVIEALAEDGFTLGQLALALEHALAFAGDRGAIRHDVLALVFERRECLIELGQMGREQRFAA